MITLRVKGFTADMDYMEVWDDEYEYDIDPSTPVEEVVFHFLREEREFDERDIDDIKDLLKSGKWDGGTWKKVNDHTVEYDTDVTEEEFTLI